MKKTVFVVLVMVLAGIAQANLLQNPGFEVATWNAQANTMIPNNWGVYTEGWNWGNIYHSQVVNAAQAHSGDAYWALSEWGGAYNIGLQDMGTIDTKSYTLSVWLKNPGDAKSVQIGFDYLAPDQSAWWGQETINVSADLTTDWKQFSYTTTTWAGAYVKVKIVTAGGGLWVDDAKLVPEPATMGILAVGGMLLLKRKQA